ncbi:MAG: prepilin peptidase [Candidatus Micrarchaeia archaeon]
MFWELLRVGLLLAIALLYAFFDLFNKREVPDLVVYSALAVALGLTFTYPLPVAELSMLLAIAIAAIGYVIYKAGYWGAGDFLEITTISLIMPIQPTPILTPINQLGLPFVLSFFISTGVAAIWIVPIYYLLKWRKKPLRKTQTQQIYKMLGIILLSLYLLLLLFIYFVFGINLTRVVIIALIGVPSAITLAYEEEITSTMTSSILPKELEEGDIIAINIMDKKDIRYFRSKYSKFGRLVTKEAIEKMKQVNKKLPVYRHAAPFAVFVLIGVIISLLFGNIILFLL